GLSFVLPFKRIDHFFRDAQDSKAVGDSSQRLCLRPPYVPFSRTVIVGMSKPGSEGSAVPRFTFRPLQCRWLGTPPVRPWKNSARACSLKRKSAPALRQASESYTSNNASGGMASKPSCRAAILNPRCPLWVNNGHRGWLKQCPLYP